MANLVKSKNVIKSVLSSTDKPLSVKTRTISASVDVLSFVENIRELNVSAIMIHGRTFKQGFSGDIDFEAIKNIKEIFPGIVLANGGINTVQDAREIKNNTGADGIGLARGVLGRPWFFEEIKKNKILNKSQKEIFEIALRQSRIMYDLKGEMAIPELRKHLAWYMHGLDRASELRLKAVSVRTMDDVETLLRIYK